MQCLLERTVTPAMPRCHLEEGAAGLLAAAQPVGRVVGLPGWLRQPIPGATREYQRHGATQVDPVPHRDVDRRDPVPRPHYPPDDLPAVHEIRGTPLLWPGLLELPDEHALGTPHR